MPSRGGTFGRPTPFQAVTRPKVFMTLGFNEPPDNSRTSLKRLPRGSPPWLVSSLSFELGSPRGDLRTEPELDATLTQIQGRLGHVVVPVLIDADGVGMTQAEQIGHATRIQKVVDVHPSAHQNRLQP